MFYCVVFANMQLCVVHVHAVLYMGVIRIPVQLGRAQRVRGRAAEHRDTGES